MAMTLHQGHWLAELAVGEGCREAADLSIDSGMSPSAVWNAVADAWGVTVEDLASRVAQHFHLPVAPLESWEQHALSLVPESVARRYLIFPLREISFDQSGIFGLTMPHQDQLSLHGRLRVELRVRRHITSRARLRSRFSTMQRSAVHTEKESVPETVGLPALCACTGKASTLRSGVTFMPRTVSSG